MTENYGWKIFILVEFLANISILCSGFPIKIDQPVRLPWALLDAGALPPASCMMLWWPDARCHIELLTFCLDKLFLRFFVSEFKGWDPKWLQLGPKRLVLLYVIAITAIFSTKEWILRWPQNFAQQFVPTALIGLQQDDGNYDVKFHDQLLGEKKGLPIEESLLSLCFRLSCQRLRDVQASSVRCFYYGYLDSHRCHRMS